MTPAQRVERIEKEIRGVKSQYGITSWETEFMASVKKRPSLTLNQARTLAAIELKVFGYGESNVQI